MELCLSVVGGQVTKLSPPIVGEGEIRVQGKKPQELQRNQLATMVLPYVTCWYNLFFFKKRFSGLSSWTPHHFENQTFIIIFF